MGARTDLGERSDVAAVLALTPVAGLALVDVGCGAGKNARELAEAGAIVLAVEPDPNPGDQEPRGAPPPSVAFVEARAERLPAKSGSVDESCSSRSLHHVPVGAMGAALAEAARVLKPNSGFLCVIEPSVAGAHFPVMRPFHDETLVRAAAQSALEKRRAAVPRAPVVPLSPASALCDFDALVARVLGQTFNAIRRERVETDEVRALFEAGAPTRATTPSSSRCCSTSSGRRGDREGAVPFACRFCAFQRVACNFRFGPTAELASASVLSLRPRKGMGSIASRSAAAP